MEWMPSLTAGPGRYANTYTSVSVFIFTGEPYGSSIWLLAARARGYWKVCAYMLIFEITNQIMPSMYTSTTCLQLYPSCCSFFVTRSLCSMSAMVYGGTLVGVLWLLPTGSWLLLTASSMSSRTRTHTHKHKNTTISTHTYIYKSCTSRSLVDFTVLIQLHSPCLNLDPKPFLTL